ncbi:deoxyribose-phosphate aldolase [Methanothermobacter wolfeii]|uniref:Deoxyribose-phosphate aldolase n=1 Tax=Methanothermobacter wolfeii TaxID=145261 RepID=A0A9E7RRS5_METWO|nr:MULTISPECIES: deoxyribose-phosphate aldolase [Methanothermobacter]NLM02322.1 deoxyribose-phosphate aldolase [Methanothermobacter wolfeii]QHN06578.1 deoxyribose-phosphate aldolase [Methanothermobacter sp. THM-1]UXH31121.1 deoxyribose-phosphate aldolase [Methanothermobacter wolfeii]SCM57669.1 Deoxyribose-phosphate aldolase [Methanothermobacter wolfeii]
MKIKSKEELASLIDHTNVRADATPADIERLCREAEEYGFRCAVVTPTNVRLASELLSSSEVMVCSVVGFPAGVSTPSVKALEASEAVENGAEEIDMVMNIGAMKAGDTELVHEDVSGVVEAAGVPVKVILETAYLTDEEKVKACIISRDAGAAFVKTSTAYGGLPGATVEDVRLMRRTVGDDMGVKAAGGIRDFETALAMLEAGADRIGTSTGVEIVEGFRVEDQDNR